MKKLLLAVAVLFSLSAFAQNSGSPGASDPCYLSGASVSRQTFAINTTANVQLVTGVAGKKMYICHFHVSVGTATNVALVEGTGSTCATGTLALGTGGITAATGWNLPANAIWGWGHGGFGVTWTAGTGTNACLFVSAANQVSGMITVAFQ